MLCFVQDQTSPDLATILPVPALKGFWAFFFSACQLGGWWVAGWPGCECEIQMMQ